MLETDHLSVADSHVISCSLLTVDLCFKSALARPLDGSCHLGSDVSEEDVGSTVGLIYYFFTSRFLRL